MQWRWRPWVVSGVVSAVMSGVVLAGLVVAGGAYGGRVPEGYVPKAAQPQPPSPTWGLEQAQAVEVCTPAGERAYLERLRCEDGSAPTFKRVGSVGHRNEPPESMSQEERFAQMDPERGLKEGELDVHIVDLYAVTCAGSAAVEVYLDMYHCPQPDYPFAPQGFGIE